jgi:hypothetical protein
MNLALWIVAVLLAVAFGASGVGKVVAPKKVASFKHGAWAEDWSSNALRKIGALELLAAVGLILPAVLDIAPVLVPLAATGLVLVMVGAISLHVRRHEIVNIIGTVVWFSLAAFVAWGRFGPESFAG